MVWKLYKELRQDVFFLILLVLSGGVCGLLYNHALIQNTFFSHSGQDSPPANLPQIPDGIRDLTLAEAKTWYDRQAAIFVDARRGFFYKQKRIAKSVSLPFTQFEQFWPDFERKIAKDSVLILYCSGYGCEDSHELAKKLQSLGFHRIGVFPGGFPEWEQAGYPFESS